MSKQQTRKCSHCARELDEGFTFCPYCGYYLNGHFLDARLREVLDCQRRGDGWKAMEQLKDLTQRYPENALFHKLLGNTYFQMGLLDWAIDHYRRAIEMDPDYADAHYDLGVAYYHRARVNDAIEAYQTVLKLDPDYHAAHYRIGLCYLHVRKLNAAVRHLVETTVVTPEYVMAHYHLGTIYYEQGDYARAEVSFKRVLESGSDDIASARYLELIEEKLQNNQPE